MKDQSFEIKVSDLLDHVATDELEFENKKTSLIPNLSDKWLSGKIKLSGIDEENVLVEIEDLHGELIETCDYCTSSFIKQIDIHWYSSRFTMNKEERDYANDEVLFFIDKLKYTINIEEMVYQAIMLETPFVKYCPECAKKHETLDESDMEEFEDINEWWEETWWNIVFH